MASETKQRYFNLYLGLVISSGAALSVSAARHLSISSLDLRFVVLLALTIGLGSRILVQIPRIKGHISVSDTLVFLTMLLFPGEAAILLAAAESFFASFWLELKTSASIGKKVRMLLLNASIMACSTALCVWAARLCFGNPAQLARGDNLSVYFVALCVMGLAQYAANSGLVAIAAALKANQPIWHTYRTQFLWTSLTYFAGALAAGVIAKLIGIVGFYAFFASVPVIGIIYFTYLTYLRNVEASTKQAEQAMRYAEELNHHISEQERISCALQESEEHFRSAFDHAAGMALVATDGRWLRVNRSLCAIIGYSEQELLATNLQAITHPEDLGHELVQIYQLLEGKIQTSQMEKRFLHKLGHEVWVLKSMSLVRNAQGSPLHLIIQIQDITERKRAEEQIHHAAFHDALTGLPNRTLLGDQLSLAIARAQRQKDYMFAVLFLDLDRFKIVNDSLGHSFGDHLLMTIARRLKSCLREVDMVARLGGDEFAVLVDGIGDSSDAMRLAERIQQELSAPLELGGHEVFTTVSIGIALSTIGYSRQEDILRDADIAMYRAKSLGKARHEVFDMGMHERAMETLRLESDLRRAIDRQEFLVYYQPIVSLETGSISGFEALARWRHPAGHLVPPGDFIPVAEETGLIIPIGLIVLREACQQMRRWQQQNPELQDLTLSVNLSGRQFKQHDLVEQITQILQETGLKANELRLEITEGVVMENAKTTTIMLNQLRALGVQLSIDDFGTGYSSLSYLHRFPVNTLKIDCSFVRRMCLDEESSEIVRTIVTLARNLKMKAVAEGVETEQQMAQLKALGCDYAQGYLFSKPVDGERAGALLQDQVQWPADLPQVAEEMLLVEAAGSIN